ncbi:MAG TPA: AAA family ATPase, partial [Acidobacteriaceae bacterium]
MGVAKQPPTAQEAEREQSTLRIYVLGQFRLERRNPRDPLEWQTVTEAAWQHQRVRALLGCLVSVGGRKLTREQIMEALWPDLEMETAASRLDRSVYSLRQLFEPTRGRPATSPLLLTEREVLVLADHPQIWIDADAFENLITRANESKDVGQKESLLREAANLYAGPFLPEDTKNEWTRTRRETLQRSWIGLLLDLADLQITREAFTSAIDPLDRLLSIDPTNEAAVQRLMSLLAQLGRRGEALRAYKRLHTALQQQYRIAPLPETRALYDALRAGRELAGKGAPSQDEGVSRDTTTRVAPAGSGGEIATVQIGRAHQSPLVGREQELEHLTSLVKLTEQAAKFRLTAQKRVSAATLDPHRRPQCVLLMGDVGIGKTRLAEEMGREAKRRGWAVAWSRVYAQEGTIPYRLWIEVLRKAMVQGVWQRQEINKRPIVFQSLSNLLPELQEMMTQVSYPSSLSPEQEQLRLWEAVKELLILISESTPLLIALDDLQWADSSSCELLAYLARRTHGYPIVIVCTCRDMELPQDHPLRPLLTDLRRENAIESLPLEPLSPDQIASLVTQVTQVSEPMVQRISTRAAGNPFFAEELARTIETEPSLAETPIGQERDPLPDTINAVLTLRMGRLSLKCQSLLSKAAVLGSSFEFQVISAMEESGGHYDEDAVLELIEEALKSGMLTEEGTGTRVTYSFWHPLLASHLYESLSAARRASQHRRAAEVFKQLYAGQEEDWAATITHHLVQGG